MNLEYGLVAQAFREEVSSFLQDQWLPLKQQEKTSADDIKAFRTLATKAGYLYRAIPTKYGGSAQKPDPILAQVIREEFSRVRAPMEVAGNGMSMLVPTLLDQGTPEQKALFIPPTIAGDFIWGQGYSEPGAGSDLASIRTRAELHNGKWVINGQKIWTSLGEKATHMFALVRTEPNAGKHDGISYLLIDLDQPGVTRRPIRQITGASNFYEFFFDDVETPFDWIVGQRGEGWAVSRTTLKHERAAIGSAQGLERQFSKLVELAKHVDKSGRPAIEDPIVRDTLARIEGWILSHRYSSYRIMSNDVSGEDPGSVRLMMKLLLTEIGHEIALCAQDILGSHALKEPSNQRSAGRRGPEKWLDQIMGSLGNSIAGGTTNIQRNIIAELGLGLPRANTER